MVKRCTTRTVIGMLNQAAQKSIFMLEKNYHGFGPPPPLDPPLGQPSETNTEMTEQIDECCAADAGLQSNLGQTAGHASTIYRPTCWDLSQCNTKILHNRWWNDGIRPNGTDTGLPVFNLHFSIWRVASVVWMVWWTALCINLSVISVGLHVFLRFLGTIYCSVTVTEMVSIAIYQYSSEVTIL